MAKKTRAPQIGFAPNLVPAPLVVQPAPAPALPDLPTEEDAPAVDHPVPETQSEVNVEPAPADLAPDPEHNGSENGPLTDQGAPFVRFLWPPQVAPIPGEIRVAIKHLSDRAKTPTYGSAGAACFDLYAADTLAVAPGRSAVVPTDLAFEVPEGYVLMIYSRSGHGFKHGIRLANNTGVVDSDYRGHVPVCLHNDGRDVFYVHQGDRVAQAQIVPVPRVEFVVVDELSSTERGENGFGSTGR